MVQFYLLSILLNVLVGIILIWGKSKSAPVPASVSDDLFDEDFGSEEENADVENAVGESAENTVKLTQFDSKEFRLIVGILSVFVGIMKILTVYRNDIPIIGDLLPALAGLAGGASLLLDYYLSSTTQEANLPSFVQKVLVDSRVAVGIACLVIAFLHFICPGVVLL